MAHLPPKQNMPHPKGASPAEGSAEFADHYTRDQQRRSSGGLSDESPEAKVKNSKPFKNLKG